MNEERVLQSLAILTAILFFPITILAALIYGLLTLSERIIQWIRS